MSQKFISINLPHPYPTGKLTEIAQVPESQERAIRNLYEKKGQAKYLVIRPVLTPEEMEKQEQIRQKLQVVDIAKSDIHQPIIQPIKKKSNVKNSR